MYLEQGLVPNSGICYQLEYTSRVLFSPCGHTISDHLCLKLFLILVVIVAAHVPRVFPPGVDISHIRSLPHDMC
jgi:hypothetical protein